MDINRLEEFVTLASCLNYTKAAGVLYLTQPVLSRHIHDLEETLGAPLFIRDTHKVALTPFGETAKAEILAALEAYHKAMRNIQLATTSLNTKISVGFLGMAVKPFITEFIQFLSGKSKFYVDYASVSELDGLIQSVENDTIDIAFITHIETNRVSGIEIKEISTDPLYIAVSKDHPLAALDSVTISELSGKPMVAYDRETNPHTAIFHEKLFKACGAEMNIVRQVSNMESAMFYAQLGLGFVIIPRHLFLMAQDLVRVPITDECAKIKLHLIWKKANPKPSIAEFIKEFTAFYRHAREAAEKNAQVTPPLS